MKREGKEWRERVLQLKGVGLVRLSLSTRKLKCTRAECNLKILTSLLSHGHPRLTRQHAHHEEPAAQALPPLLLPSTKRTMPPELPRPQRWWSIFDPRSRSGQLYLALLSLRCFSALFGYGYIHPDEWMQSGEPYFGFKHASHRRAVALGVVPRPRATVDLSAALAVSRPRRTTPPNHEARPAVWTSALPDTADQHAVVNSARRHLRRMRIATPDSEIRALPVRHLDGNNNVPHPNPSATRTRPTCSHSASYTP